MLNGTSKKKAGKIVLLACSNKSEIEVFNELADQLKILANMLGREFAGSILRPQIWALSALDNFGKFSLEFLNNIFIAGAELIRDEKLKKTTLTAISSELINKKSFITQIQSYYQQVI